RVSDTLSIRSSKMTYEVRFEDDFAAVLAGHLEPGDHIVVDSNILELYRAKIEPLLEGMHHTIIKPSEEQKSYQAITAFIETLLETGFRKNNRLFAIGGGITQDIVAFTASIMFRGVSWIFYPTTLLAQCDSCIGSKTSINFGTYKNQLGGFYPPIEIINDLSFLDTLSPLDFRSGMGEMLHYFLVSGEDDFQRICREYDAAMTDKKVLRDLVFHSLDFKRGYAERDEFDQGPRNVFNYGHSFGHAIESITHYRIPHGIAVSFGMDIANAISAKLGLITEEERLRIRPILEKNWGELRLEEVTVDNMLEALSKDKKNVGNQINVILTRGLGDMFKSPLEVTDDTKQWLGEILSTMK
ncbi:MAG: AroB-related putative sugar phosphate phospholyase (cyclizing), partial [Candidatus Hydrogenedentota bacterium]